MDTIFQQRYLFDTRKYVIKETGIDVFVTSISSSNHVFLSFERLGLYPSSRVYYNKGWLGGIIFSVLAFVVIILSILMGDKSIEPGVILVYPLLFLVCATGFFLTYKKRFLFADRGATIAIDFLTNPDKDTRLKQFINALRDSRDRYLIEKYGKVNKKLSYQDQYHSLTWLRDNDVIPREVYEARVKELEALFSGSRITGFGSAN